MENDKQISKEMGGIKDKIYTIRGVQVILDRDIAFLYVIETRRVNEQVKRNIERFPLEFMFQLDKEELAEWKSHFAISNSDIMGLRRSPYAFTEQGVAMLATVLKTKLAIQTSLQIMKTFVEMRHYLADNALVFKRLDRIELKQIETEKRVDTIFKQLEEPREKKAILFFKGQMFDATVCIENIIREAKSNIILIDGYVDTKTLELLCKKKKTVSVEIYTTTTGCKLTQKEITDFNNQYDKLQVNFTTEFHDRFMILDKSVLYHIGASIKDAGKKAFEISIIDDNKQTQEILKRL